MDGGVIQISRRFYFQLFLFVDKHPPSIFTLRDFVAAFAGLFLRRLCLGLFYTVIGCREFGDITTDGSHYGLDGMWQDYSFYYMVCFHHYERFQIIVMRDYTSLL
jgi:hypothetical protein